MLSRRAMFRALAGVAALPVALAVTARRASPMPADPPLLAGDDVLALTDQDRARLCADFVHTFDARAREIYRRRQCSLHP